MKYQEFYRKCILKPKDFWSKQASQLAWIKEHLKVSIIDHCKQIESGCTMLVSIAFISGKEYKKIHIKKEIIKDVRHVIGIVASFRDVLMINRLSKTKSGEILRKLLRNIANNMQYNIRSTINDFTIIDEIKNVYQRQYKVIYK
ncbi:hypothetical protein [Polaribacter atrinae]|uniref:Uncharacterized protein n=1 Tax=Polaribacter atrinae TaxID=1333662 RepID=A0A176TAG3_9FLAO|nr:hypothetical protein [Polaribacter atrinae]OAD44809.1 hypothetical protein LPB303_10810 [Polaribacter atrinae]